MNKDKKSLLIFYAITLAVSLVLEILYIVYPENPLWVALLMWVPGAVGIVCAKVFYPEEKLIKIFKKINPVYVILAILIPLVYLVASYLIAWGALGDPANGNPTVNFALFVPVLLGCILTAAGEEIGWRGFAYPVLKRACGPVWAVLINGFVWGIWHLPMILGGVYQAQVSPVYGVISFLIEIMLIAVVLCWLRGASGSVLPAILLHAVHNMVDQAYLQPMSTNATTPYFAGEQGMITIAICALIAAGIVIWNRKGKPAQKS